MTVLSLSFPTLTARDPAIRTECDELLRLGAALGDHVPMADARLQSWQNAVTELIDADLEPWRAEVELDRLVLELRRICLGMAHAASDRALRSPRDRDLTQTPDGEELSFGYERDIQPETLEARCVQYAPAPAGWSADHVLFSSGQAAMNSLLLALAPRGANPATPPRIRHLGGYFETDEYLAILAAHGMARELSKQSDEPADVLILEPVYFDRAALAHVVDVADALRRHMTAAAGAPSLVILDTTLIGPQCDLDALLQAPPVVSEPLPLLVRLSSGLKLDQAGLELANVGIVGIYRREDAALGSGDPAGKLRKMRTLTGGGLGFDAIGALQAPWFLDRDFAQSYSGAVLENNALLAQRLAEIDGLFSLISHPSLIQDDVCAAAAPFCLLQLQEDSAENYRALEAVIAREAKARNLHFDKGGSFGFRGHRYEAILPEAGEITPFLRVAMGARAGWSRDGIIEMLCDIASAPSLESLA